MRINIYAEEITPHVELIEKETADGVFAGLRFWLHLPVTLPSGEQAQGPFMHRPGDDDSSAVTFWGKRAMLPVLQKGIDLLRAHYGVGVEGSETSAEVASIAGELMNLSGDDLDNVGWKDSGKRDELLEKIRKVAASALGQTQA